MHSPPHPGEVIHEQCLEPLGLTVKAAAEGLGVSPEDLASLLHGQTKISAEMAIRLQKAFGSTAETWLQMQLSHDLWHAEQLLSDVKVRRFYP